MLAVLHQAATKDANPDTTETRFYTSSLENQT
jgi:hypothetical protein